MLDLKVIGFTFAVEPIGEEFGKIEAHQVHWSGIDGIKKSTEIKMEPC